MSVPFKKFLVLKDNNRPWHVPIVGALCVGLPLFIGLYFNNLNIGLSATLGGLVILYYQPTESLAKSMLTLLVCSFGFLISLVIGLTFSFNPYLSALVIGLFAMGVNWITTYLETKPPSNLFFILIAAMASFQPFNLELIPQRIGYLLLGTMLACLLAFAHALLTRNKQNNTEDLQIKIKKGKLTSLIDSVIIGVFIFISLLIGHVFKMQNPYWIPISCLAILQGISKQHIWERTVHRIVGTFIGLGICWILLQFCNTPLSICISILVLQYLTEVLIPKNYALAIIVITPMAILLTEIGNSFATSTNILISARFLDITIGSLLGAIGGWIIYNQRFKKNAIHQLRKTKYIFKK